MMSKCVSTPHLNISNCSLNESRVDYEASTLTHFNIDTAVQCHCQTEIKPQLYSSMILPEF